MTPLMLKFKPDLEHNASARSERQQDMEQREAFETGNPPTGRTCWVDQEAQEDQVGLATQNQDHPEEPPGKIIIIILRIKVWRH